MPKNARDNQRHRTRKDILRAAARLMKSGRKPTMDEVADEALVSRATVYRYFSTIEALLLEAPLDRDVPDPESFFREDDSSDPVERVDRVEAALHAMCFANETQIRAMLASSLAADGRDGDVPLRQNRRRELIEAALEPVRSDIPAEVYEKLCGALALVFGTEGMIVCRDVLCLDPDAARDMKSWAVRALVRAALAES